MAAYTVHFTSTATGSDSIDRAGLDLVGRCGAALMARVSRFRLTDAPDDADFIIFVEPPRHKFPNYAETLAQHPIIRQFAERCFAYDWATGPAAFLPGVYPGIRRSQWDPARVVSGGYLLPYNEAALAVDDELPRRAGPPETLLSFRGALSHQVRVNLSRTPNIGNDPEVDVSFSSGWFTHTADEKREHVERLLSAKFALCPRGAGPATFRIYEAMAVGRAPVIVSDDWAPPSGPDWGKFALAVSEARIADLPRIVREREGDWVEMGNAAREAWREFFAYPTGVVKMLEAIEAITLARRRGETLDELRARWSSRAFKSANGWSATQRLHRVVTSAEARSRLRGRLVTRVAQRQ